jgi:hypothetical protein
MLYLPFNSRLFSNSRLLLLVTSMALNHRIVIHPASHLLDPNERVRSKDRVNGKGFRVTYAKGGLQIKEGKVGDEIY